MFDVELTKTKEEIHAFTDFLNGLIPGIRFKPKIRPGLPDIGLFFMPDRFPESGTRNAPEYKCLHKPRRQPSDSISCQNNFITSTIFVGFVAYLPRN